MEIKNFDELVTELAASLLMASKNPSTFPRVLDGSFRVGEPDMIGRMSIMYTVESLSGAEERGSAIEETEERGVWRLL